LCQIIIFISGIFGRRNGYKVNGPVFFFLWFNLMRPLTNSCRWIRCNASKEV
jgi:hypothetical protein